MRRRLCQIVCPLYLRTFQCGKLQAMSPSTGVALRRQVVDVKQDCAGVCHFVAVSRAEMLAAVQGKGTGSFLTAIRGHFSLIF